MIAVYVRRYSSEENDGHLARIRRAISGPQFLALRRAIKEVSHDVLEPWFVGRKGGDSAPAVWRPCVGLGLRQGNCFPVDLFED